MSETGTADKMYVVEDSFKIRSEDNASFISLSVESKDTNRLGIPSDVVALARDWLIKHKGMTNLAVHEISPPYPADLLVEPGTVVAYQGDGPSPLHKRAAQIPDEERKFRVDVTFLATYH